MSQSHGLRRRALVAVTALALLALAGCSAPTQAAPAAGRKAQAATVLVGTSGETAGGNLAYNIARSEGYFADEKIDIDEVLVNGAPLILQALIANQANVGFLSLSTALQGREAGKDIKLAAAVQIVNNWTPIVSVKYLEKKGIDPKEFATWPIKKRFAAVKGSTWAVNAAGGLFERASAYLAKKYGLDPERDIQIIPLDQVSQVNGIKTGSVNVWLASAPNNGLLVKSGDAVELLTLKELVKDVPLVANARSAETIINDSWAKSHKSIAKRFFAAYQKGADFVTTHSAKQIIASLAKVYPDLDRDRLVATVQANKDNTPPDSRHSDADIQAQIAFALASGNITDNFTVKEAYTDAYLPPVTKASAGK